MVKEDHNLFVTLFQIRMQAQGSLLQGSMMSNFINIYQTEGTRGLWRVGVGVQPGLVRSGDTPSVLPLPLL